MPNYIKTYLVLSLILLLTSCKKDDNYTAYFGGEVINPRTPYIIFSKGNQVIDTIPLDKNNRFSVKFDSLAPGLYSFKHDPDYQYVYFDKNDSLNVSIDTNDFDQSITFSGRGDRKNNFMTELVIMNEVDRHRSYDIYNYEYDKFSKTIDSAYAIRENFYAKNKEDIKWSKGFDYYAKARLKLNYFAKKEYYPYVHARRTGEQFDASVLPKDYYNFRKSVDRNDDRLVNFSPFIRYLTGMLNNMAITRGYKKGDLQENSVGNNIDKLNIADSLFTNKNVKNEILNTIAFNYLLEDQNIANNQKFLERFLALSTDTNKDNEIRKIGKALKQLNAGSKLPAVALVDTKNKAFDADTGISKETVIFFWTSCAKAHMDKVQEKVSELKKKHPKVNFVAVNVDTDAEWKKTVGRYNFADAQQLRATDFHELKDRWVFTKINRTIILNADGTIKNAFTNLLDAKFTDAL